MRISLCSVALVVAWTCSADVVAAELIVPDQYVSIQAAINASVSGDLITVRPGTYNERLDIGPRSITLKGQLGAAATIIDPQGVGGVVIYSGHGAANGWTLDGFTIRNGLDSGIYVTGVSATVKNCVFLNNQASRGGGAHVRDGANVTFDGCDFVQNTVAVGQCKGGALFAESASVTVRSTIFQGNTARDNAAVLTGGAVAAVSAQVSVSNCQFISNRASRVSGLCSGDMYARGGAAAFEGSSSVTVSDSQFEQNQALCSLQDVCYYNGAAANSYGGALYAADSTSLAIVRCQFSSDNATAFGQVPHCCSGSYSRAYGGAIFSVGGSLAVADCSFSGVASVAQAGPNNFGRISYGGAIYRDGASATVSGTTFSGCSALGDSPDGRGGAIYCSGSLSLSQSSAQNCRSISGGAIFCPSASNFEAQGLQVAGCTAEGGSGGAIWLTGGTRGFTNCTFISNTAQGGGDHRGGAIYAEGGAQVNFTDCGFAGNRALSSGDGADRWTWGGACAMFGVTPRYTRCHFTDNAAIASGNGGAWRGASGGATVEYDSDAIFTDCVLSGNKAEVVGDGAHYSRGGTVFLWNSDTKFVRCDIANGQALPVSEDTKGGGVYMENVSRPGFSYCNIVDCAANEGAGLSIYNSEPYVVSTAFRRNSAVISGGGMFVDGASTPYVLECSYQQNQAPSGGAIKTTGSGTNVPFVVQTSFCGNTVDTISGSILGGEGNTTSATCAADCNGNGVQDADEIAANAALDINHNGVLDSCESDCNHNGQPDSYELGQNLVSDCNGNGVPDSCDIAGGVSNDTDTDGTPDECQLESARLVPFEYPSIVSAINAANNGDTIFVAPGAYYEKFNLGGKQLTLKSVGGAAVTYIDGNGQNGTLLTIQGGQNASTVIDGFTFWYAQGGYAIYIQNASPTIRNCRLLFNQVADGAAFRIDAPSSAQIFDCLVESNTAHSTGGGLWTNANPTFTRTMFRKNVAYNAGGAVRLSGGTAKFDGCTFSENSAQGGGDHRGGAISASSTLNFSAVNCVFMGNIASSVGDWGDRYGRGGACAFNDCLTSGATPPKSFDHCTFTSNTARAVGNGGYTRLGHGGAIFDFNSDLTYSFCTFASNKAEVVGSGAMQMVGGAIYADYSNPQIADCTFDSNSATSAAADWSQGGALFYDHASNGNITRCNFNSNTAYHGGAFYLAGNSQPNIRNSDFVANGASYRGGAVYANGSPGFFFQCAFRQNTSPADGGSAIYGEGVTGPNVFGSTFCGNAGTDVVGSWTSNQNTFSEVCNDCDGNGVDDSQDVANGAASDCNGNGVPDSCEADSDGDGAINACDGCPSDPAKISPGACGCGASDADSDGDGVADCIDGCPSDPAKTSPGACGCGASDSDSDGDGLADCIDGCPSDANKQAPGVCGCGASDSDSDGDGAADCIDGCPSDPAKTSPGACGCGASDADTDGDGTSDCSDPCPNDPFKIDPGVCGCGAADTDTDGDGTADCTDGCPYDPAKVVPGVCGCGTADIDSDGDGLADCADNCPTTPNPDQTDCDGNAVGDACSGAPDCNGNGVPDACDIARGDVSDCNANGVPDTCDLSSGASHDSDGDGVLDECEVDCNENGMIDLQEIAKGLASDCNGNSVIDSCEDGSTVIAGSTAPWGGVAPLHIVRTGLPQATGPVRIRVEAIGDLDALNEFAVLRVNGVPKVAFFGIDGLHCAASPEPAEHIFTAADWNQMLVGGQIELVLDAPAMVGADECPNSMARLAVNYQNPASDCDGNGASNLCEIALGTQIDCDGDRVPDACSVAAGQVPDCDGNGVPDPCDAANGSQPDCDGNGVPDPCEIASGAAADCNGNGAPDLCEVGVPGNDCDGNGQLDVCEIASGLAPDCNQNGLPDACDIVSGSKSDCNGNGIPDSCDIASGSSADVDSNGVPDECKSDCNGNGLPDAWEIGQGIAPDCNGNGVPDSCDVTSGSVPDCNGNGIPDSCDIASGSSSDVDSNGIPDGCQPDCNGSGTPDDWDIANGVSADCNGNGAPDDCDLASGAAPDCNNNGLIDSCDIANGEYDKNVNQIPDVCEFAIGDFDLDGQVGGSDLALLLSLWGLPNAPICDLDHDGIIAGGDLAILLSNWS